MVANFEEWVLLCYVEGCEDLHWVADESIDTDATENECDVGVDGLEVEHKNTVAVLLVGAVAYHGEDHEE